MIIDILSDLHFDYYFKLINISKIDVQKAYDRYFLKDGRIQGDVLVVAGDIGHDNKQNITILKMIQRLYGYKAIICVLGNHDYLLTNRIAMDNYENSFERAKEMKELINAEEGLYCLDGDVVEIEGVKFGGAMGWYSSAFLKAYYPFQDVSASANNGMWKNCMPEGKQLIGVKNFDDLYFIERPKMEAVHDKCDIMITHINPSFLKEHIPQSYRNNQTTTFFCFNGHDLLRNTTAKHWIFGHTHDSYSYVFEGVECHVNAYEHYHNINMKSIDLIKEEPVEENCGFIQKLIDVTKEMTFNIPHEQLQKMNELREQYKIREAQQTFGSDEEKYDFQLKELEDFYIKLKKTMQEK